MTVAAFLLALGILLPYTSAHGLGIPGTVLLPMHFPVLLCGFLCGPAYGGACGALLPLMNCLITGMPAPFPMLPIMLCELTVYGLASGLLLCKTALGRKRFGVYAALPIAMTCGRAAYASVFYILLLTVGEFRALSVTTAVVTGLPGMILQLFIIPPILLATRKNMTEQNNNILQSAKNLINRGKATCVVIKDHKIVSIENASGIGPILSMYENGLLENAVVVDKIVGKAAACIMALGGVRACYGITVSKSAVAYLKARNITLEYQHCAEYIINRKGDGLCPMEDAVKEIDNEEEALKAIRQRLSELRAKK